MYDIVPQFGGVIAAALAIIILVFVTMLCLRLFWQVRSPSRESPDSETGHYRVQVTSVVLSPTGNMLDLNLQQMEEKTVPENIHEKHIRGSPSTLEDSGAASKTLNAAPPSDEFDHKHGIKTVECGGEGIYQEEFAVSGPGLKSATTNQVSKFTVHTSDSCDQPPPIQHHVSAELKSLVDGSVLQATVVSQNPSTFELSYIPTTRGRHQLTVQVKNTEIGMFPVFVQHPPSLLGSPVMVIEGVQSIYIAVGDERELFVTEPHQYTVLDAQGQRVLTIGSRVEKSPFGDGGPTGITTDGEGNVYIASGRGLKASDHKVHKFNRQGEVVKSVGKRGRNFGEFDYPWGVRYHNHHVYVCDSGNGRVQVFDSNLNFVRSFGTHGDGPGQLKLPWDIDFDSQENIYVLDYKHQVLVFSEDGQYLNHFGQRGRSKGSLSYSGLCVNGDFVYITENSNNYNLISVFLTSGEFIHSFGKEESGRGELNSPHGIAVDQDGFVFVCNPRNSHIQVF